MRGGARRRRPFAQVLEPSALADARKDFDEKRAAILDKADAIAGAQTTPDAALARLPPPLKAALSQSEFLPAAASDRDPGAVARAWADAVEAEAHGAPAAAPS